MEDEYKDKEGKFCGDTVGNRYDHPGVSNETFQVEV